MSVLKACYMCNREATSREHVPPLCFFPGNKDSLSGKDFRKNLITVPSCKLHNSEKSGDDLYLLHLITVAYQNNPEGLHLFTKRIRETTESRPYLLKTFFGQSEKVLVNGLPTLSIELDMKRFESRMTCMANAIFFFHFKTKWKETLEIFAPSARYSPNLPNSNGGNVHLAQGEVLDDGSHKFGENQDIFFFQFIEGVLPAHRLLRMVFYQGFVVWAIPFKRKEYLHRNKPASA
jgi:hypothetical protein